MYIFTLTIVFVHFVIFCLFVFDLNPINSIESFTFKHCMYVCVCVTVFES